jgi:hypothetical protein
MDEDKEIAAMSSMVGALEELEPEERERVLRWACDRYSVRLGFGTRRSVEPGPSVTGGDLESEDLATLYDAANPKTDPERALVAGYWFQVREKQPVLDAQRLNSALKNLGHGVGNITSALTGLKDRKPALAMQVQKTGKSKQARKKYKLTAAGIRAVHVMVAGTQPEEE